MKSDFKMVVLLVEWS